MENTKFQSGMKIVKQVLTNEVNTTTDAIQKRVTDIVSPGTLLNVLDEFNIIVGTNSTGASPSISVQTGVAYNANGERIVISNPNALYNSSNPFINTPDGIGGNTLTPQSTGSLNISLPANTTSYVFIDYLETIDPNTFTLHKITNQKLFYSESDGYQLGFSHSASIIPAGFSSVALFLGSVGTTNTLTNGIASINQIGIPIYGINPTQISIQTPNISGSDDTLTYSYSETLTLNDHIKAVGSGTVSPKNPHGLSATDIGVTSEGQLIEHQEFLHAPGIVSSSIGGNASALFLQVHTSGIASENFVQIQPLLSNELVVVQGVTIDSTNIPNAVQFSFVDSNSNPLPNGVHTFYVDSISKTIQRALPGTFNPSNTAQFRIWDIQWTSPALIFNSENDYRLFGNLANQDMRFELLGAIETGLATGNRSLTFTYDGMGNLIQLGVGGDNGTISGGTTLITFSYSSGNLIQVGTANYGHRQLLTTITYSGTTITQITEQVI
jgi:hypothetical protein